MLAHYMGIRPWEHGLLTVQQFDDAVAAVDEAIKQNRAEV